VLPCPSHKLYTEAIIEPGDPVAINSGNQKQADFLVAALAKADPHACKFSK
jgi:malonate decarboxylase alpha subunit